MRAETAPAIARAPAWNFGSIPVCCGGPPIQPKLAVGAPAGALEREADRLADGLPTAAPCSACAAEHGAPKQLARTFAGGGRLGPAVAPPIVDRVLASSGVPLQPAMRAKMEGHFGYDFGHVRLHHDAQAARSAAAVNALAYTVGADIVLGAGQYTPGTSRGDRLLAHELAHVVQQGSGGGPRLQRFVASEVSKVAPTFQDMLTQIRKLINDATTGDVFDWDFFVEISGGYSWQRKIPKKVQSLPGTIKSRLFTRYLVTCRCGLIDMRHFLQMLYISNFATAISQSEARGNEIATGKGREHELTSESESRFAPEDTPSNALGASTNLTLPGLPSADKVFDAIKDTLTRCDPIGWSSLSTASKNQVLSFYGAQVPDPNPLNPGGKLPKNPNETAVPDILPLAECGGRERSLPFEVDPDDPKTIVGRNFLGGAAALKSASDMRAFVLTQRDEIIKAMPLSEKIRFIDKLSGFPFWHSDKLAIEKIYRNSTADELRAEP
jgi:hypothetical protein